MSGGALASLRVLDLTHFIAGPYCTRILAGLGADVIKVERPGTGDPTRRMGPFPDDEPDPEKSGTFLYLNTLKRDITLNLKSQTGKKILLELVQDSDVLVESFSPRVMPSLGLSYDELIKVNPSLIMVSVSNFGQTGPYRDYKLTEMTALALGGLMYMTGEPDREPLKNGGSLAQFGAGQNAAVGALGAVFQCKLAGEGTHIDVSIFDSLVSITEVFPQSFAKDGQLRTRSGNWAGRAAWGLYPCADGHVGVIAGYRYELRRFAQLMDNPEFEDAKYDDFTWGHSENADDINAAMLPWLLENNKEDIYHKAQGLKLPFGYVCTTEDLANAKQLASRDFFADIDHPKAGTLLYPGAPFKMSETPWRHGRAPLMGEHNEEVYCDKLGYTKEDLVRLRERGIV